MSDKPMVVGVIPSRYASQRLPAKPLVDLLGKPMVQRVYEQAKKARLLDRVVVATDDTRIEKCVRRFGGEVMLTSPDIHSGSDRVAAVASQVNGSIFVNIQGDEPLIHPMMIDSVARALLDDKNISMATLRKRIDDSALINDPNVVKVVVDRSDFALYFSRAAIPYLAVNSDIKEPVYYKHIGLYAYTKDFLFTFKKLPVSTLEKTEKLEQLRVLEEGFRIKAIETKYDTIGVDTPDDLERIKKYFAEGAA